MLKKIVLNGQIVEYELTRKKVKNINLRVRRDGTIAVSCNYRTAESRVEEFLKSNSSLILNALNKAVQRTENTLRPVNYQTGEQVSVYGEHYVLRVERATKNNLVVGDGEIIIYCRNIDDIKARCRIYENWKKMELQTKVLDMCDQYYPHFKALGVEYPQEIRFKRLKSKWGSCQPKNKVLTFNYNLFEAPDTAIEYVVVHEFAHFLEANHSARFYAQVEKVLPDWRERRKLLNEY